MQCILTVVCNSFHSLRPDSVDIYRPRRESLIESGAGGWRDGGEKSPGLNGLKYKSHAGSAVARIDNTEAGDLASRDAVS